VLDNCYNIISLKSVFKEHLYCVNMGSGPLRGIKYFILNFEFNFLCEDFPRRLKFSERVLVLFYHDCINKANKISIQLQ